MRWKGRRQSGQIEDRRSAGGGKAMAGGGIGVVIIALIVMFAGGDPTAVLNAAGGGSGGGQSRPLTQEDADWKEYIGVVLADTEEIWTDVLSDSPRPYRKPKLVLFRDGVQSGCGYASAQVGPFYCGEDETIYIDTSFFGQLKSRFGAKGEFAPAYVIAHEVGHHVQKILGTLDSVQQRRREVSEKEANALTVKLELQADYYAGVWAHHARSMASITEGDIREAMEAAEAIGDDKLQMEGQGYVVPDSFTHGTSEQRMRWFRSGWKLGDLSQGDTFRARNL